VILHFLQIAGLNFQGASGVIENRQFRLNKFEVIGSQSIAQVIERWIGKDALRWYISQITDTEIVVEATFADGDLAEPEAADGPTPGTPARAPW
jgi:hypothetical protein